ncbi:MAG: hypothetical protein CVU97_07530 [Firmicutes bacterium HGW-Firmicutes-21]|nr:MAG: hypothetical protein CVU97_07530 [Firmicutes bacterium HGW-Firmicutes-21]
MFIACTEKCAHQKDGICVKNDCSSKNEYISGAVSCPLFEPVKNQIDFGANSPEASEDQKHFLKV